MKRLRGGAVAMRALLLALIGMSGCMILWGCGRPEAASLKSAYVRIDALLPLHPIWSQVAALDRQQLLFERAQPPATGVALNLPPLPDNFVPPQAIPPNLTAERQKRLDEDARRYVTSYQRLLQARDDVIYSRFEKEETAKTRAEYERQLAAERARLTEIQAAKAAEVDRQTNRLRLQEAALNSQIRAYSDQPFDDAVSQRTKLQRDIAALDTQRRSLFNGIEADARTALAVEQQRLYAKLSQTLVVKRKQLGATAEQETSAELARLKQVPPPVANIGSISAPPGNVRETPLPLPSLASTRLVIGQEQERSQATLAGQKRDWSRQRANMVAAIRSDISQVVMQIFRERGWKMTAVGTRGASDVTDQIAHDVRAQWKHSLAIVG